MNASATGAKSAQQEEVIRMLQDMVRIDTTNPPGNEIAACNYIRDALAKEGIESEIFEGGPGRGNIVARLKGNGGGKPFTMASHIDVVAADPAEWKAPPFSGDIIDNCVWGRGSLDCKNMTVVELEVFLELKRQKMPLKRDVIFYAAADEEQSGTYGMEFMVREHFDKIECEYAINEGGGLALPLEGKNIYTVQNAEKGVGWYRLTTHGTPGHGSVPKADNALVKMSKALMRLSHPQPIRKVKIVSETLNGMAALMKFPKNIFFTQLFNPLFSDIVLNAITSMSKDFGEMVSASLRDTISPTMINAGYKENVIPSTCTAIIDCRILPGQTHEKFMKMIKDVSGVDEVELLTEGCPRPTENPVDNEFYRVVKKVMPMHDPDAVVLPLMMTGATDSRFLREKGIISLGFLPFKSVIGLEEYIGTMHSMDERCPIDGLTFAYDALFDVVSTFVC